MLIDAELPESCASPMTREIADLPHPTPNPDEPHAPGKPDETEPVTVRFPLDDEAEEEQPSDSFFDDVNQMLSQSIEQPAPDPVLGPLAGEDASSKRSRPDDPVARLIRGEQQSPRTSEVFKAVVALRRRLRTARAQSASRLPAGRLSRSGDGGRSGARFAFASGSGRRAAGGRAGIDQR